MFTGIVTHKGEVKKAAARNGVVDLRVATPLAKELRVGDSIALNGVCLTATETSRRNFRAHVMDETLARSTLRSLRKGAPVNLELPARLVDRLGGHMVQGHVDGIARVARIENDDGTQRIWLAADDDLLHYMVRKGSVAVDGVSLTIVEVGSATFQVALIPHTLTNTTLGQLKVGSEVNIEIDVIAKYVERLMRRDQ